MIYVLVDIDETMLSVPPGINAGTSNVMFKKVFGIDAHEEMIDNVGKTELGIIMEVLRKFGMETETVPSEAYEIWGKSMDAELKRHPVKILPGMEEFLKTLSGNKNVKLTLLTGNSPARSEAKLRSAGFDKYFRDPETGKLFGVFGDETPVRGELINILSSRTKPGDSFVVVDDSLIGAKMSKDNDLTLIAMGTGKASAQDLQKYTPHYFENLGNGKWQKAVEIVVSSEYET
ncbi:MAG: HAD family hydrolase [Patescibacteria group bacterium]